MPAQCRPLSQERDAGSMPAQCRPLCQSLSPCLISSSTTLSMSVPCCSSRRAIRPRSAKPISMSCCIGAEAGGGRGTSGRGMACWGGVEGVGGAGGAGARSGMSGIGMAVPDGGGLAGSLVDCGGGGGGGVYCSNTHNNEPRCAIIR